MGALVALCTAKESFLSRPLLIVGVSELEGSRNRKRFGYHCSTAGEQSVGYSIHGSM